MTTTQTPKFTQEFGSFIGGGQGHTLVLASPGQADLLIQTDYKNGGYSIYRRGDTDVIANRRTQGEARTFCIESYRIDQAG